jgi:hypothetical protein
MRPWHRQRSISTQTQAADARKHADSEVLNDRSGNITDCAFAALNSQGFAVSEMFHKQSADSLSVVQQRSATRRDRTRGSWPVEKA